MAKKSDRKCRWCGGEISDRSALAKTCCLSHTTLFNTYKMSHAERIEKHKNRICKGCQGPIPETRLLGANFCSDNCANRTGLRRRRRNKGPAIPLVKKKCKHCGNEFTQGKWSQIFCKGSGCSYRYRHARDSREINDAYVIQIMALSGCVVPTELIELKRAHLRLQRIIANGDDKTPLGANQRIGK